MWLDMPLHWLERNKLLLQRLLIMGGIALFCIYVVPRASQRDALLLVAVLAGLGAVVLFLQRPYVGIICLIPVSLVVPIEIGTGTGTTLNAGTLLLGMLLGLWILEAMVLHHAIRFVRSRAILVSQIFLLTVLIALIIGRLSWFVIAGAPLWSQIGGLAIFVLSVGAFWLVAHQVRELRWLQWMTWLFLALAAIYIIGRLLPGLSPLVGQLIQPSATGSLFWTWLVALALGLALFHRHLALPLHIALLCLVAATLYVAYFQAGDWKSGWIPPLVSAMVIVTLRWPQLLVFYVLFGLTRIPGLLADLVASDAYSYNTRIDAWLILFDMVKKSPLFGFGPANYYWYTPLFPIRGYYVQFSSHSQYLDLIMQTGVVGLLVFTWLFAELGRLAWRLRTQVPPGFAKAYVIGALGGLVGTVIAGFLGDWILPFVYNVGLGGFRASALGWLFLGGLVALEQITVREA